MRAFSFALCAYLLTATSALASEQVGTLTQMTGKVTLMSSPSKTAPPEAREGAARVKYKDEFYYASTAKLGDRLERGTYVRTDPGSNARVVFENGDQYNVGPGTYFRVDWDKDDSKAVAKVNLEFGKLRGVVEKGGPRSRLQIRTRSATMGVRGTDFFIASGGPDNGTEVVILRGKVEVKTSAGAKPMTVDAGHSLAVTPPPADASAQGQAAGTATGRDTAATETGQATPAAVNFNPATELRRTTQEELLGIQKATGIEAIRKDELPARVPDTKLAANVLRLETTARETTLKDIQKADPKLFAVVSEQKTEDLNHAAVQHLLKDAPKAPSKRKPYKSELESLDSSAYEQYFKPVQ